MPRVYLPRPVGGVCYPCDEADPCPGPGARGCDECSPPLKEIYTVVFSGFEGVFAQFNGPYEVKSPTLWNPGQPYWNYCIWYGPRTLLPPAPGTSKELPDYPSTDGWEYVYEINVFPDFWRGYYGTFLSSWRVYLTLFIGKDYASTDTRPAGMLEVGSLAAPYMKCTAGYDDPDWGFCSLVGEYSAKTCWLDHIACTRRAEDFPDPEVPDTKKGLDCDTINYDNSTCTVAEPVEEPAEE